MPDTANQEELNRIIQKGIDMVINGKLAAEREGKALDKKTANEILEDVALVITDEARKSGDQQRLLSMLDFAINPANTTHPRLFRERYDSPKMREFRAELKTLTSVDSANPLETTLQDAEAEVSSQFSNG